MSDTYTQKYGVSYHLPICRDCDELCVTFACTQQQYESWLTSHAGHNIELGPEIPIGGQYVRER